ncbi:MAG: hypothetical protein CM15mP100_2140 [Alphaproteobacteria bacterium]|nr:MAG: hypothetical protein CM15mP100_2140 [Alphaproteobacteria bacterium]
MLVLFHANRCGACVRGQFDEFDTYSAELGAQLLARQKSGSGSQLAADGLEAARMVIDALTKPFCCCADGCRAGG